MTLSVREQLAKGDLDGAWKDILVLFRMAHHFGGAVPWAQAFTSNYAEKQALELAMVWAADKKQTAERLRVRAGDYRELPRHDAADPDPRRGDEHREHRQAASRPSWPTRSSAWARSRGTSREWTDSLWTDVVTTPWELARARRAFRLLYASRIVEASVDPWFAGKANSPRAGRVGYVKLALTDSPDGPILAPATLDEIEKTTPLVRQHSLPSRPIFERGGATRSAGRPRSDSRPADLAAFARRDAARSPRDAGDGRSAPHLADRSVHAEQTLRLRPGVRPETAAPGLARSDATTTKEERPIHPVENAWLLYSVGPDGKDDHAERTTHTRPGRHRFPAGRQESGSEVAKRK